MAYNQNLTHFDHVDGGPAGLSYPSVISELFRAKEIGKPQKNAMATATVSKESSAEASHEFYQSN